MENKQELHRIDYSGGEIWVDKEATIKRGGYDYSVNYKTVTYVDAEREDTHKSYPKHLYLKVAAQSPNLSLPNIPYVEIEEQFDAYKFIKQEFGFSDGQMKQWEHFLSKSKLADFGNILNLLEKLAAKKYTEEDLRLHATRFAHLCRLKGVVTNDETVSLFDTEYIQSLQPKPVSIEVETTIEWWDGVLNCWVAAEDDETEGSREVPVTYTRDGKTFLKVIKVNHE